MEPEKDIFEIWIQDRNNRPWLRKKIDHIQSWWRFNGRFLYRDFITGVNNIRYWLPVIWKDRNWDYSFIFDILSHKLKAQAKYIGERDNHIRAKRDAEIMMTCVRLIEKIKDEYYTMEHMSYHKTKNWFEPIGNGLSTWESRELEENFDDYFAKYPLIHKRVLNGEGLLNIKSKNNKRAIAANIGYINHNRARKLLFKIIENHVEGWWD